MSTRANANLRPAPKGLTREPSLPYAVVGPMVRWTRVATFFMATFCLTHALSVGWVLLGGSWGAPSSYAFANALMLCPAAVAFAMQRFVCREPVVEPLAMRFRPTKWFVLAWLLPPAVMLLALGLSVLVPGSRYAPDMSGLPPEMASFRQQVASVPVAPLVAMVGLGLVLGPTLNAIGGLGEEIGWRGFLYKEMQPLGFWRCSLATGGLWALMHIPLLLEGYGDRDRPMASALGVIAFAVLLAPILHLVRMRSRSVVACGILHGTMGSTRLVSVAFVRDAGGWAYASIPAALVVVGAVLLFLRPENEVYSASTR